MYHIKAGNLEKKLLLILSCLLLIAFYIGYGAQLFICHESSLLCLMKKGCLVAILWTLSISCIRSITPKTYAIALLFALLGAAASLMQAGFYVCSAEKEGLKQIFHLSSYSWSTILFSSTILSIAAILTMRKAMNADKHTAMGVQEKIILIFTIATTLILIVDATFCPALAASHITLQYFPLKPDPLLDKSALL
jgi:hypothetical protein